MDAFLDRHVKKLTLAVLVGTAVMGVALVVETEGAERVWAAGLGLAVLAAEAVWARRLVRTVDRERAPIGRRLAIAEERVRLLRSELEAASRARPGD